MENIIKAWKVVRVQDGKFYSCIAGARANYMKGAEYSFTEWTKALPVNTEHDRDVKGKLFIFVNRKSARRFINETTTGETWKVFPCLAKNANEIKSWYGDILFADEVKLVDPKKYSYKVVRIDKAGNYRSFNDGSYLDANQDYPRSLIYKVGEWRKPLANGHPYLYVIDSLENARTLVCEYKNLTHKHVIFKCEVKNLVPVTTYRDAAEIAEQIVGTKLASEVKLIKEVS